MSSMPAAALLAAWLAITAKLLPAAAKSGADNWPSHPVLIISTFAAGGAADILARIAADQLTKALGQQFFVETHAGAGGPIVSSCDPVLLLKRRITHSADPPF